MRMYIFRALPALAVIALLSSCAAGAKAEAPTGAMRAPGTPAAAMTAAARSFPDPPAEPKPAVPAAETRTAVLAGGCFWGMEGVFERLTGVIDVVSGYSGGKAADADYESVSTGTTGHAESVKILYDPSKIAYGTLLKIFFQVAHDPTELDFQGPDHGTQYRSAVFYADDAQKRTAESYIAILNKAGVYRTPIVTEVVPLKAFYPAEDYHQNFMDNNPAYPYIVYWDAPKVAQLVSQYPELVAPKYK
jgi:peptide-methionine (S)-S-oxide reductase